MRAAQRVGRWLGGLENFVRPKVPRILPAAPMPPRIGLALGGGFAPLIATALAGGGTAGVSIMLILLALITLTATLFAPPSYCRKN